MDYNQNDYYNKKIEIEQQKKELEKKYGAHFNQNSNLPPEIESEWLKNIEQFEEQFDNAKKITVWQYIGQPGFKKAEELTPVEITNEWQRLSELMTENNIALDTLCEVDIRELYRFVTEELFFHEIDDMRVEGMVMHFTYEEFHPNAEYDIQQAYDYFFRMTMAKMENIDGQGYDLLYIDTKNYHDANGKKVEEEKVINKINNFLDSFDYFKIISNKIGEITINKDKTDTQLICNIHYEGCFNNNPEAITYKGKGIIRLKPSEYGGWDIYHIDMPGLKI